MYFKKIPIQGRVGKRETEAEKESKGMQWGVHSGLCPSLHMETQKDGRSHDAATPLHGNRWDNGTPLTARTEKKGGEDLSYPSTELLSKVKLAI